MPRQEFKPLFCQHFHCSPAEYEERAFRKCLPWHARLLAPVVRILSPDFFAADLSFIRDFGSVSSWREVHSDIGSFQEVNRRR